MRTSSFFLSTLKEAPADAEVISQNLMLRSGMIKKHASGIYTWMPLGLRVLRKVENIVREELNRSGALELLMPAVQSAELWQESGRWANYGAELLRIKDRHDREFVIGPTHEEVITDTVRREVKSYRQLPLNFYQIQTKFRDEIRPRFGVMRGREFIMKDAYSFHCDYADLQREYQNMYETYSRIFTRLGLHFRAVAADTGSIGGTGSHEFHVIAAVGEDDIAYCPDSDYAANVELAEALMPTAPRSEPKEQLIKVATPHAKTCDEVANLFSLPLSKQIKSLVVVVEEENENRVYLILIRADHQLNEIKLNKISGLAGFRMATNDEIQTALSCSPGSIGPIGVDLSKITLLYDRSVINMSDFICGANEDGFHWRGVNFDRDLPAPNEQQIFDLRDVVAGDPSPDGKGNLTICRGIEVGHIFQLRTKYSEAMQCSFLNEHGQNEYMEMGCYGIGITRVVAAAIEQNHDDNGIIFPTAIAPFQLALVPMNYHKSALVKETCDRLYQQLLAKGIDVLLDDRELRAGVLFADIDLIGIPYRIVIGERGLKEQQVEYRFRKSAENINLQLDQAVDYIFSLGKV